MTCLTWRTALKARAHVALTAVRKPMVLKEGSKPVARTMPAMMGSRVT